MTDLNTLSVIGRLTRDVELKYTLTGLAVAGVSIACSRSVKKGEEWETEVSYFDATLYGRTAESLKPYLLKGNRVAILGHLKQDRWEKDGQRFSRIKIEVEQLQLLGGNDSRKTNSNNAICSEDFPEDIPF